MRLILTQHTDATFQALEALRDQVRALDLVRVGSVDAAIAATDNRELNVILASPADDLLRLNAELLQRPMEERPIVLLAGCPAPDALSLNSRAAHPSVPGSAMSASVSGSQAATPNRTESSSEQTGHLRVRAMMWTMGDAVDASSASNRGPGLQSSEIDDLQQWLQALAEMDSSAVLAIRGDRCVSVDETFASRMGFVPLLEPGDRLAKAFSWQDRRAVLLWLSQTKSSEHDETYCRPLQAYLRGNRQDIPVRLQRLPSTGIASSAVLVSRLNEQTPSETTAPPVALPLDQETGLPQSEAFGENVRQALHLSTRNNQSCAVLVCRFDGLPDIARRLGQAAASQVVQHAAIRLRRAGGGVESMARLSAAELGFVFVSLDARSVAEQHILRLQRAMQTPLIVSDEAVPLVLRFGIADAPQARPRPSAIIRAARSRAAASLLGAKHSPRQAQAAVSSPRGSSLEHELEEAIEKQQFEIRLQPIIHLHTFTVRGAEVLVRWRHPQRGLLSPGYFLPVAESTRQIERIGKWVLDTVCSNANEWSKPFAGPTCFTVNVSPVELHNDNFLASTISTLGRHFTGTAQIELEITETAILASERRTAEMVDCLRRQGVRVALDDFGVGYSSLAHLREIPFSKLKIDRSFVHSLSGSHRCRTIIRSMIELGRGLHIDVNAEGVETPEQLRFLFECGADEVQGYLFAPPMSADRFASWLNGYQGEKAACDSGLPGRSAGASPEMENDVRMQQDPSNVLPFCRARK